jgi:hypothetical protein
LIEYISCNYKISTRSFSIYGVSVVWRNSQHFLNMILQLSYDWLTWNVRSSILTNLGSLYDYTLYKWFFLPKYVELFEKFLKFWSFLWMFPEQVRHAVYVLHFRKLITQTLSVTNTYYINRSFAATFVKKHTFSHKFRHQILYLTILKKWFCVAESWKTSLVTKSWQAKRQSQSSE